MQLNHIPSFLFTPASQPQRFVKAKQAGAKAIILDLEDGVAEDEKELARENVIQYCQTPQDIFTIVRINHMTTSAGLKDLLVLKDENLHVDAILYPKLESITELTILQDILRCSDKGIALMALLETSKGVIQAANIVSQSHCLSGVVFGAADYAADVGCAIEWDALYLARLQLVQAAAQKQLAVIDSPYFDFKNESGLATETKKIKMLGFTGKMAIHPDQINTINQAFQPTTNEVIEAQAIVKLYEENNGKACQYEGKMIDVPVYKHALRTLALAK